jgi:DNA-binding transcriptional MerR regulator
VAFLFSLFSTQRNERTTLSKGMTDAKDKIVSIGEAAERCGVCTATIRYWEKTGKLMPVSTTMGNHRRYLVADLDRLMSLDRPAEKEQAPYEQTRKEVERVQEIADRYFATSGGATYWQMQGIMNRIKARGITVTQWVTEYHAILDDHERDKRELTTKSGEGMRRLFGEGSDAK